MNNSTFIPFHFISWNKYLFHLSSSFLQQLFLATVAIFYRKKCSLRQRSNLTTTWSRRKWSIVLIYIQESIRLDGFLYSSHTIAMFRNFTFIWSFCYEPFYQNWMFWVEVDWKNVVMNWFQASEKAATPTPSPPPPPLPTSVPGPPAKTEEDSTVTVRTSNLS